MRECCGVVATAGASVNGAVPLEEEEEGGERKRKDDSGGRERGNRGAVKLCKTI